VDYWLARLKDLPISADRPLKERLTVRDDGLLRLDLSHTKVANLTSLAGMPLGALNLVECADITDIAPLRELPSLLALDLTDRRQVFFELALVSGAKIGFELLGVASDEIQNASAVLAL